MNSQPLALITGAAGGIGSAIVKRLQQRGIRCIAVSRSQKRLEPLRAECPGLLTVIADVTQSDNVAELWQTVTTHHGTPTLLAHCVGNSLIAGAHRTRLEAWQEVRQVNLDSAFFVLRTFVQGLLTAKMPGSAVFISSVVAGIGVANHEAIAAAKAGIEGMVRSAAATYAASGIRINAVAPGLTETPLTALMLKAEAMRLAAEKQYPLGGVNAPDDVAGVMDWLLSDEASRLTGLVLPVDGGFTAIRPLVR